MHTVRGRWYLCRSDGPGVVFPIRQWPEQAVGVEFADGVFRLLELAESGRFVPAVVRDMDDQVKGSFGASTFDSVYAETARSIGPVPFAIPAGRSLQSMRGVPVLTLPPTRQGMIVALEPTLSISPATLTIGNQRFVALGTPPAHIPQGKLEPDQKPRGIFPGLTALTSNNPESELDARCHAPRKGRLEPKTAAELMRLVKGRWYYCGDNQPGLTFPTFWPEYAHGMELGHGHWYLLELTREGKLVRSKARTSSERVQGTFSATTYGAFMSTVKFDMVPRGPLSPETASELVLAIPQPRNGFVTPAQPTLSSSPRTLTIDRERFVDADNP